ncbi:hypothetical protein [Mitsuaria sp. 7]|uniref:hypothetical protein n=1 Tax=Mitsuaria sp. 7 TaxID=1658665 RepID=UPI0007DD96B1|nr:hypothetical protein [Mitsuaria sp. 7]ANH66716.1 hypothetical protein ABE85_02485 [Mitsuaria sp. 7]
MNPTESTPALDEEADYERLFDGIYREVNRRVDMNNNDMVNLVHSVATHGAISEDRYRRLIAKGNPQSHVDAAARIAAEAYAAWALARIGPPARLTASANAD